MDYGGSADCKSAAKAGVVRFHRGALDTSKQSAIINGRAV